MKKTTSPSQPAVTYGTLAKIAREMGLTRAAVHSRYHKGDVYVVNRVAQIERAVLKKRQQAARNLAEALGA